MITLTKEIIENACDYIPLERKHIWCRNVATIALQKIPLNGDDDKNVFRLPDRYEENTMARQMALTSALAQNYLKIYDEDKALMIADYDELMGSHLVNQLERMKSDKDIRDKIFNILYDFNELKKMLNTEIYSRLGHHNDTVARMTMVIQMIDPNEFGTMAEQVQELSVAVNDYEKRKAGRMAGDTAKAAKATISNEQMERAAKIIENAGKKKGEAK